MLKKYLFELFFCLSAFINRLVICFGNKKLYNINREKHIHNSNFEINMVFQNKFLSSLNQNFAKITEQYDK